MEFHRIGNGGDCLARARCDLLQIHISNSHGLTHSVIAGLDPAIHLLRKTLLRKLMDARIKSGHDECVCVNIWTPDTTPRSRSAFSREFCH
jgi:hypothetical protein